MAIGTTNGTIRDLASFDQVTGSPRQIAGVYFYALLDPLVELAHGIAKDFLSRPQFGTDLSDAHVMEDLARLRPVTIKGQLAEPSCPVSAVSAGCRRVHRLSRPWER